MQTKIQYDQQNRMKYNPFFHAKHNTGWTEEDLEYMCKYWEVDSLKSISMALERPEASVATKMYLIRKKGLYDHYKNLNKHW